jgi:uncharacterized Zn finger protein
LSNMWWDYQDSKAQKARLQREIAKRVKRGEVFAKLEAPEGNKKLVTSFWGKAWCNNLESYQVYEYRLPRGRSYLRQGNVYNLEIEPGRVSAVVAGSELYETRVDIEPLSAQRWQDIIEACAGQVNSMLDLLAGKLGEGVLKVLTHGEEGLFPKPKEIRFNCSCPDFADMCKHVSAVLYGVGVLLDKQPEWFFTLRSVDQADLLATAGQNAADELAGGGEGGELAGADLSALFGIDLGAMEIMMEPVDGASQETEKKRVSSGGNRVVTKPAKKKAKKAAKNVVEKAAKKTAKKPTQTVAKKKVTRRREGREKA